MKTYIFSSLVDVLIFFCAGVYRDALRPATCVSWAGGDGSSGEEGRAASGVGLLLLGMIDGGLLVQDPTTNTTVTSTSPTTSTTTATATSLRRRVKAIVPRPGDLSYVAVCGDEEAVFVMHVSDSIVTK